MKEFRALVVVFALVVGLGAPHAPAEAELCAIDNVPAATLLLPVFQVDLAAAPRRSAVRDTVVSISNLDTAATIVHVTFRTDMSVATINFDLYLTAYDVQTFSVADIFNLGFDAIPRTFDGLETGTENGEDPCTAVGGGLDLQDFRDAHSGRETSDGMCYGQRFAGGKGRGYITFDNANRCSTISPSDPGYFGPGGVASNVNGLSGQYFVTGGGQIQGDNLVHVEAYDSLGEPATGPTFYGRYTSARNGIDQREPLATTWAARYLGGKETYLTVWRDSGVPHHPFPCGKKKQVGNYPLGQTQILAFDEQENQVELFVGKKAFKAESQIVRVGTKKFPTPYDSGWTLLNLNVGEDIRQSYVSIRQHDGKRRSTYPAVPLESACLTAE